MSVVHLETELAGEKLHHYLFEVGEREIKIINGHGREHLPTSSPLMAKWITAAVFRPPIGQEGVDKWIKPKGRKADKIMDHMVRLAVFDV